MNFFGLSPLKIGIAIAVFLAISGAFVAYRQSLINDGWDRALDAVKKQDTTAKQAARQAQRTADECYDANGTWSVITGKCTPEAKP